jgi:hypothetical protein
MMVYQIEFSSVLKLPICNSTKFELFFWGGGGDCLVPLSVLSTNGAGRHLHITDKFTKQTNIAGTHMTHLGGIVI